jgi:deoxyribodipyrimidine photo-lyase
LKQQKISIHWFRRDLRLSDNCALYHSLVSGLPVMPIFIFDSDILSKLQETGDLRVNFIHREINKLNSSLKALGSSLHQYSGRPEDIFRFLLANLEIDTVFANADYEPYGIDRDNKIKMLLASEGVKFLTFKDHVIFEKSEVVKPDNRPYTVFTPYSRKWIEKFEDHLPASFSSETLAGNFQSCLPEADITLAQIGFKNANFTFPSELPDEDIIRNYQLYRDIPSMDRTSHLGLHLRFGTVSIRKIARLAYKRNLTWLSELIWREFFLQILFHFPYVQDSSFKTQYDRIEWLNDESNFNKWCEGKTGYPLVDAGMRELNRTGFMHNRVRMVTASFLTKHLLIDWRWGEAYFAMKLLDFELSSNNGNWQWAAGTGCDAAPYFRIFSPQAQADRFDPGSVYIRQWVPEYGTPQYPDPIIDHKFARERCMAAYRKALDT